MHRICLKTEHFLLMLRRNLYKQKIRALLEILKMSVHNIPDRFPGQLLEIIVSATRGCTTFFFPHYIGSFANSRPSSRRHEYWACASEGFL